MIQFVNAKLNLGLHIVRRRPDGYHDLETLFYPVGIHNGTPQCPAPFCDVLEINRSCSDADVIELTGRQLDCPLGKNLAVKALNIFREHCKESFAVELRLEKHLPDGAGLGGGSADASFVLRALNELSGYPFTDEELARMALALGADCPFFILNRPAFGEGVGEKLVETEPLLRGMWCVIVKPPLHISTREAFAGVTPDGTRAPLRELAKAPLAEWKELLANDFERSLFPRYPELREMKEKLYAEGAAYASMSGSGASLFGIYLSRSAAEKALGAFHIDPRWAQCYTALCLL